MDKRKIKSENQQKSETKNVQPYCTQAFLQVYKNTHLSVFFNQLLIFNSLELIVYGVRKQKLTADIKTITNSQNQNKTKLNISIYLSNEEPFKPLLLDMFCKISKMDERKKKSENWQKSEMTNVQPYCTQAFLQVCKNTCLSVFFNQLLIFNSLELIVYGVRKQ